MCSSWTLFAGELLRAVISPSNDLLAGWSPDGSTLLFTSDRSGALGVWGVSMASGKPAEAPRMIKPDLGSRAFTITVTASGTLIYGVQASSQNVHIARVDFTTGEAALEPDGCRRALPGQKLRSGLECGRSSRHRVGAAG